MALILIVDDDPVQRRHLEKTVNALGHRALHAGDGEAALAVLASAEEALVEAVLLDLIMPGLDGMGTLAAMRARGLERPTIVLASDSGLGQVASAMRAGAVDFCIKPGRPERVAVAVAGALERAALKRASHHVGRRARGDLWLEDLVSGPASARTMAQAARVAREERTVLLEGEAGTGKTALASAIHGSGPRQGKPFQMLNAAAFDGATFEDFGSREGTLYLRSVEGLTAAGQAALLNMLTVTDARLIIGADVDLIALVRAGHFREDLYYRLAVAPVFLPPLRKRLDEMTDLANAILARLVLEEGRGTVQPLSGDVVAFLKAQKWPGNLRQLEGVLLRALHLSAGRPIEVGDFPALSTAKRAEAPTRQSTNAATPVYGILPMVEVDGTLQTIAKAEETLIRFALSHHGGRMAAAARDLGIGRSTLYRKLDDLGIDPAQPLSSQTIGTGAEEGDE
jgi:DNA-binding NtrC family response regulator